MWQTDGQTDGRTDRITTPKTTLAYAGAVKTDVVMDDDRGEDDDGWCDTVDDSCEKDMKSVEGGWRIVSEEVDSRGEDQGCRIGFFFQKKPQKPNLGFFIFIV